MKYVNSILELIGRTPLVKLQKVTEGIEATVLVKLESRNPGGSIKDRIGIAMIEAAERDGKIKPGGLIIEATSGNNGIGVSLAAKQKGYNTLFVTTDKASQERVRYLKALGAEVVICSAAAKANTPEYYVNTAMRLAEEIPNSFMLNQYDNPANRDAHTRSTGPEIWEDTEGKLTHFIAGIGTGGTITGTARYLKQQNPNIKVIAADPVGSCVKVYKDTGRIIEALPYLIEGVGQDRIPANLDLSLIDDVMNITDKEAFMMARRLGREEGIFCGGSSGMNVTAALRVAKLLPKDAVVVTIICDTGERYLTKHHSDEWLQEKQFLDSDRINIKMVLAKKNASSNVPAFVSVTPSDTVEHALGLMNSYELSQLPVVEHDTIVGNIKENKLMASVIERRDALQDAVSTQSEQAVATIDSHQEVQKAITMLKENTYVIVTEFGKNIGILTRHDVLDYL